MKVKKFTEKMIVYFLFNYLCNITFKVIGVNSYYSIKKVLIAVGLS